MARSVMAATFGLRPTKSASSSMHSQPMIVESMSATSSFLRRFAAGTTLMSSSHSSRTTSRSDGRHGIRIAGKRNVEGMCLGASQSSRRLLAAPCRPRGSRPRLEHATESRPPRHSARKGDAPPDLRLSRQVLMRKSMSVDAVLIAGPTASGKSAAALALAERLGGAIINANSMQVYRELRMLTARPSRRRRSARAASSLRPCRRVGTLFRWAAIRTRPRTRCAEVRERGAVADLRRRHRTLFRRADRRPVADSAGARLRCGRTCGAASRRSAATRSSPSSRNAIEATAAKLKPSDTQRVLRAADVLEATGRPLSAWQDIARAGRCLAGLHVARFVIVPAARHAASSGSTRASRRWSSRAPSTKCAALAGLDPVAAGRQGAWAVPQLRAPSRGRDRRLRRRVAADQDRDPAIRQAAA